MIECNYWTIGDNWTLQNRPSGWHPYSNEMHQYHSEHTYLSLFYSELNCLCIFHQFSLRHVFLEGYIQNMSFTMACAASCTMTTAILSCTAANDGHLNQ